MSNQYLNLRLNLRVKRRCQRLRLNQQLKKIIPKSVVHLVLPGREVLIAKFIIVYSI
jgi:hypothetical protein